MKHYILTLMLALTAGLGFVSCSDDDPDQPTIFPITSPDRDALDLWLQKNYTSPYNIDFKYKMEDIESDYSYTLVPADSAKSAKLAILVKYMWLDAYAEAMGQDFVKSNIPRVIHLVGSYAYNSNGTVVLGTAEGGLKVTLYMVNELSDDVLRNYDAMTEYYFHTMHHEFTHILNQKKPYDTSYNKITESGYISGNWYQIPDSTAHGAGFITPYAMSEGAEDFAEMLSGYITHTQAYWDNILADAKKVGGDTAVEALEQKLEKVRNYMQESWNCDIDEMRAVILRRGTEMSSLDLEHLK